MRRKTDRDRQTDTDRKAARRRVRIEHAPERRGERERGSANPYIQKHTQRRERKE